MGFLIAEWTNSYPSNYFLSQMKSNTWLPIRSRVAGTEDLFGVCCCNTTQSRSESHLNVNQKEFFLQRDTEGKPLENWH